MGNTVVRRLTIDDVEALLPLASLFWAEGRLPGSFNADTFRATWGRFLDLGIGHILGLSSGERLVGAPGFLVAPDPNDGALVAQETFWYVEPESRGSGLRLLRAFEDEALALGVKRVLVAHLKEINGPELKRIYEHRGYRETETTYMKEIS